VIFEADTGFLADLRALLAPIASEDSIPITASASIPSVDSDSIPITVPAPTSIASADPVPLAACDSRRPNPLFFDTEPTRVGCKQRCRDMSDLSLCLCGQSVHPGDVGLIKCNRAGCETVWVSNSVDFSSPRLNKCSTISSALGMRTREQGNGVVKYAFSIRRHGGSSYHN